MPTGGSISSITIDGRSFGIAADADVSRDLGGFTTEMEPNGDGTVREIKTRKPWMLEGLEVSVDDANADQEFLQENSDAPGFVAITIEFADESIYQGDGKVSGDVKTSSQAAKCAIVLSGPGKLTRQA